MGRRHRSHGHACDSQASHLPTQHICLRWGGGGGQCPLQLCSTPVLLNSPPQGHQTPPTGFKTHFKMIQNKSKFCRTLWGLFRLPIHWELSCSLPPTLAGDPRPGWRSSVGLAPATSSHLYLVLDVVPDPKHHNAEDSLRKRREFWATALSPCPTREAAPPPSVPSPPDPSAHEGASPSLVSSGLPDPQHKLRSPGNEVTEPPLQGQLRHHHATRKGTNM